MTVRPLEEDLQRLGLSDNEIRRSLSGMGVLEEGEEADFFEDDEEEDFEEAYLSDLAGDDDDSDDEVDESMRVMRMKKGTAKSRKLSKQYYKAHKGKISAEAQAAAQDVCVEAASEDALPCPQGERSACSSCDV